VKFISDQEIEAAAEALEKEDQYEKAAESLQQEQPEIMGWLFSDSLDLLTRSEREYLLYLILVIFRAIRLEQPEVPRPDEEMLSLTEEKNWTTLGNAKANTFHERLDAFFEHTDQEDLLAFAEDALSDHEDEWITKEGREALFIVLKTVIDCWTRPEA
jgi:hypothetical protein